MHPYNIRILSMINDKTNNQVNYTLGNQKITFDFLKSQLWRTVDILRGSLNPTKYQLPVVTLLFLKRLNDTFEENAEKITKERKDFPKVAVGV